MTETNSSKRQSSEFSPMSLGSWHTYGRLSFEAGVDLLGAALDHGITSFDVAYYPYAPHTEVLFGRLIREAEPDRDKFQIIEKVWHTEAENNRFLDQVQLSLRRLNTDFVDTLVVEHPRPGIEIADIADQVAGLIDSGLTRSWSLLNWLPEQIREVMSHLGVTEAYTPRLAQMKHNIARRFVVEDPAYEELYESLGLRVHASDTMEGGVLAGRVPERKIGIDTGGIRERMYANIPGISVVASDFGITSAQLALAFSLGYKYTGSLLFGASRPEQIEENVKALAIAEELGDQIRAAVLPFADAQHTQDAPYTHMKSTLSSEYVA